MAVTSGRQNITSPMMWRTGPTVSLGAKTLKELKTSDLSCWKPALPITATQVRIRTLLAMKMAPVMAAMRDAETSAAAAKGMRSQSAKAKTKIAMPALNRYPAPAGPASATRGTVMTVLHRLRRQRRRVRTCRAKRPAAARTLGSPTIQLDGVWLRTRAVPTYSGMGCPSILWQVAGDTFGPGGV